MNDRYYADDEKLTGYYAIRDRLDDDYVIWVDCRPEHLALIVDALNRERL